MISETLLTDTIPDEVLYIPGFNLARKDRLIGRGGTLSSMSVYELFYARSGFLGQYQELQLLVSTTIHR